MFTIMWETCGTVAAGCYSLMLFGVAAHAGESCRLLGHRSVRGADSTMTQDTIAARAGSLLLLFKQCSRAVLLTGAHVVTAAGTYL